MDTASGPIPSGIRTACGRARYQELAARSGVWAQLRLRWFVAIACLRDRQLPRVEQSGSGEG